MPRVRAFGGAHEVAPHPVASTEATEAAADVRGTEDTEVSVRTTVTMSRDGVRRINLRVDVRLDLRDVAVAVAMASYEDAETIAEASRERLLAWARDGVRQLGLDHIRLGDADGYEEELDAARRRLVELGIFPEDGEGRGGDEEHAE